MSSFRVEMDAQSYLPQPAEAADNKNAAFLPVESADEEIVVFTNNNITVSRSSLKNSPPGGKLCSRFHSSEISLYLVKSSLVAPPRISASSGDSSADKVSVEKADSGAEADKKSL